ncbi:MAG: protein kinase [Pseudomonadota bacterium]
MDGSGQQAGREEMNTGDVLTGSEATDVILNGIYQVEDRLAQGGMGEVYKGRVIETGDPVAIKMILPQHAGNELMISLFRKEASVLHNLYHEAIVRYYVFSVDPVLQRPYLVMEYAEGPSLGGYIKAHGALSPKQHDRLRRRLAEGLQAAHAAGVCHRDISPDNIILVGGKIENAKLIDFGIAKATDSDETLIGSGLAGKMAYISPEQLGLNGGEVTAKSDIYSLGLVLAEAATGKALPMTGSQLSILEKRRSLPDLSEVPERIRPLICAMLAPNPEDRPRDMAEVAAWFDVEPLETTTMRPGQIRKSERQAARRAARKAKQQETRSRRWRRLIGAGVTVSAAMAIGAVVLMEPGLRDGFSLQRAEAAPIRLEPLHEQIVALEATVGATYDWTSRPFSYNGDKAGLILRVIGRIPPGLSFSHDGGISQIAGVPTENGTFSFLLDAESSEGLVAEQMVVFNVAAP